MFPAAVFKYDNDEKNNANVRRSRYARLRKLLYQEHRKG